MTKEYAEEIIEMYESWEDKCCTCHMGNSPCGKCENMPSEEDYKIAIEIVSEFFTI